MELSYLEFHEIHTKLEAAYYIYTGQTSVSSFYLAAFILLTFILRYFLPPLFHKHAMDLF